VKELEHLVRPQLLDLKPYEPASPRDGLRLNANESAWRSSADQSERGLNRYPEPVPLSLATRLAEMYRVDADQLVVTRGSDEGIDLLMRVFCRDGRDGIVICPPTFGMYRAFAQLQGAEVIEVPLVADRDFALNPSALMEVCGPQVKLVFLCSPNNPTGQLLDEDHVLGICRALAGRAVVVVDEAYVEFSGRPSLARYLDELPNLVVLRTLSKAFALAGARLGALIAGRGIADLVGRAMPPYAFPTPVLELAREALQAGPLAEVKRRVQVICDQREALAKRLDALPQVQKVWPSDANFLLVRFRDPGAVLNGLENHGILVRDFSSHSLLAGCLRITVGTPEQNACLLAALEEAVNV